MTSPHTISAAHDLRPQIVLGTMYYGTKTTEATARNLLDAFVELGGTWIDTANCYSFWEDSSGVGGASEEVIGRWLADEPARRDRVRIATKVRQQPTIPHCWPGSAEGLSADAIHRGLDASLARLGVDTVDLLWAHAEDRTVPLEQTVGAFGKEVERGRVGLLGASNHRAWRVERSRAIARDLGVAGYEALQLRRSYVTPRPGAPVPEAAQMFADEESLDYVATEHLPLWVYLSLLYGTYVRPDRPLSEAYDHPGTTRRRAALADVVGETGATANQVVLSWLMSGPASASPIVGVSTVEQLTEAMAARDLTLTPTQRTRLDEAT